MAAVSQWGVCGLHERAHSAPLVIVHHVPEAPCVLLCVMLGGSIDILVLIFTPSRNWAEGKVLIFDDSFEHEVWQEADSYRLILIVDVWHPELSQTQRQTLSPI